MRTARRSARTIFPASSAASAAAPVCRASGFTICGIRSRRSCSSRAFPSSRFRNGSVIRISPRPQTFTRTCRMWRRSLSPRARFRSSKSERCKIIPAIQSARFSGRFGKDNGFFEIAGLIAKPIISPAISKRFSHWYWRSLARSPCLPVRRSRIRPTSRQLTL